MAGHHRQQGDEFEDEEIAEETQELMQIIFGEPDEWDDVIETAPKQMRQACRVAKDKAAALRRYCIEAGLLKLPVRTKLGRSRHACPKDVNRKRRSLETSLQKLFAKGRANGAGVEEFVWGISYGDGSIRIGSDEVLAPIWQREGYMEKVRLQANNSKLTAQQFKDSLRSADLATLLSTHLTVPERKAAVTSLGPVCSPPMSVTSFTAAFGTASGRLAWWPPAVPVSKAWKLKADETIAVLEAMAQNIVTHFGAGTTVSQEDQKRGCLEVFRRCVVGPHVAAGLKGSDSQKVAIFELIGEKALVAWQLPKTSGEGQEGKETGVPSQHPAARRVRRTKAQMGPQPFPCPHCVGEYSTAAALRAHRCKARKGGQPSPDSRTEAHGAAAEGARNARGAEPPSDGGEEPHWEDGAAEGAGGTVPPSNGGEESDWDDGPDGALDELIEEVEKDATKGTTESQGTVRPQVAAAKFLRSVQVFAASYEQDSDAPLHLLQLLGDLLAKGDVGRKLLYILHTLQGVGTVSTRLLEAGLDVAVPTDALLIEAHTETVVQHLRAGSGNWPKFIEKCELLEDLAENMGGELVERWLRFQRVILDPSVASELVDQFDRQSILKDLEAFWERAKGVIQGQQGAGQLGRAPSVQQPKGQRNESPSPKAGGPQSESDGALSPELAAARSDRTLRAQPGPAQSVKTSDGAPSTQTDRGQRNEASSEQPGEGHPNGAPNVQLKGAQHNAGAPVQPKEPLRPEAPSAQPGRGTPDRSTNAQPGIGQPDKAPDSQPEGVQPDAATRARPTEMRGDKEPSAQPASGQRNGGQSSQPTTGKPTGSPDAEPAWSQRTEVPGTESAGNGQPDGAEGVQLGGTRTRQDGPPKEQLKEGKPTGAPSAQLKEPLNTGGPIAQAPSKGQVDGPPSAQPSIEPEDHARLPPRPTSPSGLLKRKAAPERVPKGRLGKRSRAGNAGSSGSAEGAKDENRPSEDGGLTVVIGSNRPPRRVASAGVSQVLKELTNGSRRYG